KPSPAEQASMAPVADEQDELVGATLGTDRPKLSSEEIEDRFDRTESLLKVYQLLQIGMLQRLLDDLEGHTKKTYEGNRTDAIKVARLAEKATAVLLFSGTLGRKNPRTYVNQPVKVACEHPDATSFKLRTADHAAAYVGSVKVWPKLTATAGD